MSRTSIKDWLWSQRAPPEVLADFEKLFAVPEKWYADGRIPGNIVYPSEMIEELQAILEGKD